MSSQTAVTVNFRRLLSALAVLSMAGCASPEPAAPVSQETVQPAAPKKIARAVPAQPEPKVPAPDELIGLGNEALRDALGAATLVRHDLDTEIWQYRTDKCVLFLFFYPKDGAPLLHHMDARGDDMDTCLKTVVRKARKSAAG